MLRRSFRVGLYLGILGGLAFAVLKAIQSRREPAPAPAPPAAPWPPFRDTPPVRDQEPTVVAQPFRPPPDTPHAEPPPAPPPREERPASRPARASKAAKVSRKAAKKSARKAARKSASPRAAAPREAWVEPSGDVCPPSHPVKAKLASRIFHLPGQLNYDRTSPDRCYRDAGAAEGDGLRQAKR